MMTTFAMNSENVPAAGQLSRMHRLTRVISTNWPLIRHRKAHAPHRSLAQLMADYIRTIDPSFVLCQQVKPIVVIQKSWRPSHLLAINAERDAMQILKRCDFTSCPP